MDVDQNLEAQVEAEAEARAIKNDKFPSPERFHTIILKYWNISFPLKSSNIQNPLNHPKLLSVSLLVLDMYVVFLYQMSPQNPFKPKIKCLPLFTTAEKQRNFKNVKIQTPIWFPSIWFNVRKISRSRCKSIWAFLNQWQMKAHTHSSYRFFFSVYILLLILLDLFPPFAGESIHFFDVFCA